MCLSHPQKYAIADRMVSAPVTQMHLVTNDASLRPRPSSAKTRLASTSWARVLALLNRSGQMVTGRDNIHDRMKAPTIRMSRLTTAITSQTGKWLVEPRVT